ncbi:MAG: ATP-binding protein [Acidobacteriota bacterium]
MGESTYIGSTCAPSAGELPGGELFFRRVIEGMRCAIVTVDRAGRVLTVNELAREILELDNSIEIGAHVTKVLARHPRLAEVLLDALEMAHPPNRAEMEIRSREEDGRTIGFTISAIKDADATSGVALFFKDLTMVERQEEQDRLRDRLAALGQMAASMAHEIRNPLASIDVTASLLKRKLSGRDEELRLISKIVDEVERLNRTVTRGLEFARGVFPELSEQRVERLLEAAVSEAQARYPEAKVDIERRFEPGAPPVACDGGLIQQVFANLIFNAFEAMSGNGSLSLELRALARPERDPGAVEIMVRDNGPGLSHEVADKIFYPFITTKKGGSGIGLAMARKIIECHHGLIDVKSSPGCGTAFRVVLPRDGGRRQG